MRLIAEFPAEKSAYGFHAFLLKEGVHNVYERLASGTYAVWVTDEEDVEKAMGWLAEFKQSPDDGRFTKQREESSPTGAAPDLKVRIRLPERPPFFTVTNFFLIVCFFLFFMDLGELLQEEKKTGDLAARYEVTEVERALLFDETQYMVDVDQFFQKHELHSNEELEKSSPEIKAEFEALKDRPRWKGAIGLLEGKSIRTSWDALPPGSLFHDIRQGEVWRLFTPALLHAGLLHIVLNMMVLWAVGRWVESRIGRFRFLVLCLAIGIFSNVFQYLVTGPNFVGFSGVDIGLIGFVWMRQKKAPWEGYPLSRFLVLTVLIWVGSMAVLELLSVGTLIFFHHPLPIVIANTAHIVGGLTGMFLGAFPFFRRRHS
jgi:GlpG protein